MKRADILSEGNLEGARSKGDMLLCAFAFVFVLPVRCSSVGSLCSSEIFSQGAGIVEFSTKEEARVPGCPWHGAGRSD